MEQNSAYRPDLMPGANAADRITAGRPALMKMELRFRPVAVVLIVGIVAIISWGISKAVPEGGNVWAVAVASFVLMATELLTASVVGGSRSATVIRTVSGTAFFLSLLFSIGMALWCTSVEWLLIVYGIVWLGYIALAYSIARADQ